MARTSIGSQVTELLPHYLAMVLLMILVLTVANVLAGPIGRWPSVGIALVVAIIYPFAVRRLGLAPEPWQ